MLEPVNESGEEVDILSLNRREFKLRVRLILAPRLCIGRCSSRCSFSEFFRMSCLLSFHILQTSCNSCFKIRVFLFLWLLRAICLRSRRRRFRPLRLLLKLALRHVASAGVAFAVFQTHLQRFLEIGIEAVFCHSSTSGLHPATIRNPSIHAGALP